MLNFISFILFCFIYVIGALLFVEYLFPFSFPLQFISLILLLPAALLMVRACRNLLIDLEKSFLPPRRRTFLVILIMLSFGSYYGYQTWDSYQVKPLNEAIAQNNKDIVFLSYYYNDTRSTIEEPEALEEIFEHFKMYKVQRLKTNELKDQYHLISFIGRQGREALHVDFYEHYVRINHTYYKIINGPFDSLSISEIIKRE